MLKNLKALRAKANLSQKELADIVCVSQQSINKYENHNVEPNIETLCLLADCFETSIDYLVGRTENESPVIAEKYTIKASEKKLIEAYRRLEKKDKKTIDALIAHLSE